jgi:hypothetical protein
MRASLSRRLADVRILTRTLAALALLARAAQGQ